jgi:hypothetical protein
LDSPFLELRGLDSNFSNVEQKRVKKIYRTKHVLSNIEGAQRKISNFSELGVLCAFARVIFFPIRDLQPKFQISLVRT